MHKCSICDIRNLDRAQFPRIDSSSFAIFWRDAHVYTRVVRLEARNEGSMSRVSYIWACERASVAAATLLFFFLQCQSQWYSRRPETVNKEPDCRVFIILK